MRDRIRLLIYGFLSVIEAIWNMVAYLLFLDKISMRFVLDIAVPYYLSNQFKNPNEKE